MSGFSECQQLRVGACRIVGRFVEDTIEGGAVIPGGRGAFDLLVSTLQSGGTAIVSFIRLPHNACLP